MRSQNDQNRSTLRWLWKVTETEKWKVLGLTVSQMILSLSGVISAWILRGLINSAVAGSAGGFRFYAIGLIALSVCQLGLRAWDRYFTESVRSSLENRFKIRLFITLLRRDYSAVTAVHSGEWMNRLTSDTTVTADGCATILPQMAGMVIKLAGALVLILYLLPGIGVLLIPGGLFLLALTYAFRKVLKRLHKHIQETDGRLRIFLSERLENLMIVRSFAREKQAEEGADEKMREHRAARMKRINFSNLCNLGFGGITRGVYVLCALFCAHGILAGSMTYGTFTAVLQLIGQIQSPFANLTGVLPRYYAMTASAERLMEAEGFQDAFIDGRLSKNDVRRFYAEDMQIMGLRGVSFSYPFFDEKTKETIKPAVFRKLNLEIKKGEYVALTGHSGCGKSTLLKLFLCLYEPEQGERYFRRFDGAEIALNSGYQGLFAYVPQGNQLMSGTIREIVAFGDEKRMRETENIRYALEVACAWEFVEELEKGIDTLLGERGSGLSEGQMQRIAIARAVASGNPILMLDESTSSLDEETESRLLNNLRRMTDRTVLIVTHRSAALKICDRVICVSEEGKVRETPPKRKR